MCIETQTVLVLTIKHKYVVPKQLIRVIWAFPGETPRKKQSYIFVIWKIIVIHFFYNCTGLRFKGCVGCRERK